MFIRSVFTIIGRENKARYMWITRHSGGGGYNYFSIICYFLNDFKMKGQSIGSRLKDFESLNNCII